MTNCHLSDCKLITDYISVNPHQPTDNKFAVRQMTSYSESIHKSSNHIIQKKSYEFRLQ